MLDRHDSINDTVAAFAQAAAHLSSQPTSRNVEFFESETVRGHSGRPVASRQQRGGVVRAMGLEPTRLSPPDPKSGAYTSSATPAVGV